MKYKLTDNFENIFKAKKIEFDFIWMNNLKSQYWKKIILEIILVVSFFIIMLKNTKSLIFLIGFFITLYEIYKIFKYVFLFIKGKYSLKKEALELSLMRKNNDSFIDLTDEGIKIISNKVDILWKWHNIIHFEIKDENIIIKIPDKYYLVFSKYDFVDNQFDNFKKEIKEHLIKK